MKLRQFQLYLSCRALYIRIFVCVFSVYSNDKIIKAPNRMYTSKLTIEHTTQ